MKKKKTSRNLQQVYRPVLSISLKRTALHWPCSSFSDLQWTVAPRQCQSLSSPWGDQNLSCHCWCCSQSLRLSASLYPEVGKKSRGVSVLKTTPFITLTGTMKFKLKADPTLSLWIRLRHSRQIAQIWCYTMCCYKQLSFFPATTKDWNNLPDTIRKILLKAKADWLWCNHKKMPVADGFSSPPPPWA